MSWQYSCLVLNNGEIDLNDFDVIDVNDFYDVNGFDVNDFDVNDFDDNYVIDVNDFDDVIDINDFDDERDPVKLCGAGSPIKATVGPSLSSLLQASTLVHTLDHNYNYRCHRYHKSESGTLALLVVASLNTRAHLGS